MERFSALSSVWNWVNALSILTEMVAGSWSRKRQCFLWNCVIVLSFISGDHFITDKQGNTQRVICSHAGALSEVFTTLQITIRGREKPESIIHLFLLLLRDWDLKGEERICTVLFVPFIFKWVVNESILGVAWNCNYKLVGLTHACIQADFYNQNWLRLRWL